MSLGLFLAILLDRSPRGENFFRTLFIYPMALSFIVTGTIWRWLLAPNGGLNVLPSYFGFEKSEFLWLSSRDMIFQFNWQDVPVILSVIGIFVCCIMGYRAYKNNNRKKLVVVSGITFLFLIHIFVIHNILPPILPYEEIHGFNIATIGVIIAAVWQYSGYPMALFLAGLRGIPESLYESAKLDGASDLNYYLEIALPNMWPITFSSFIILSHISLKMFDLIFAMAGADTSTAGHPSILMYLTSFRAKQLALGASMSVILFILAGLFIIPHLVHTRRTGRKSNA
jgi:glucose/mannose transport system permease protein